MKLRARFKEIKIGSDLKPELVFGVEKIAENLTKLKGEIVDLNIKQVKDHRSINQNDYYWSLMDILKDLLGLPLMELHKKMLKDYGVSTYIEVDTEALQTFLSMIKYYYVLGERDNKTQVLVLKGSSEMNTKEFASLLERVEEEAEAQGIPTLGDKLYQGL